MVDFVENPEARDVLAEALFIASAAQPGGPIVAGQCYALADRFLAERDQVRYAGPCPFAGCIFSRNHDGAHCDAEGVHLIRACDMEFGP